VGFLYQIALRIYYLAVLVVSLFHAKARNWILGRKVSKQILEETFPLKKRVIWFHAASLGEFEQGRPVIEGWRQRNPDFFILLSFYSPSGYLLRKDYEGVDLVCYIPWDTKRNVASFLDLVKPEIAVFIKYEFWPNMLKAIRIRSIRAYLISGHFRPDQLFFRWYGKRYLSLLRVFDRLFVQNESSLRLLQTHGIDSAALAGDTRADRVLEIAKQNVPIEGIADFCGQSKIIIAGSSWKTEEEFLEQIIRQSQGRIGDVEIKLIIAPHDTSESHLAGIEQMFGASIIRYSQLLHLESTQNSYKVLLIDRIGMLNKLYRYAHVAVVGGGFGKGLHNTLEPAAFGLPVIFGPKYSSFPEASELIKIGSGITVRNYQDFHQKLYELFINNDLHAFAGKGSRKFVDKQAGASALILRYLMEKH